jgi:hypothetical protein
VRGRLTRTTATRFLAILVTSAVIAACGDGSDDVDEGGVETLIYAALIALAWIVGIAVAFAVTFIVVLGTVLCVARAVQWAWSGGRRM